MISIIILAKARNVTLVTRQDVQIFHLANRRVTVALDVTTASLVNNV